MAVSPQREWKGYGQGVVTVQAEPTENTVRQVLARVMGDPNWKPPTLPVVAVQLIELSRRPDTDFQQVAKLLLQDPVLTGRLLQRANSAYFAGSGQTKTVREAVARLGLEGVRNLVLEFTLEMRVFRVPAWQSVADTVRKHSVATGYLSGLVCRYTSLSGPHAFLCGLLADVGLAVGLAALAEGTRGLPRVALEDAWPPLMELHPELSTRIAAAWKLDLEVQMVLRHHHILRIGGMVHPRVAVLVVAEVLADALGAGLPCAELACGASLEQGLLARETLGITSKQYDLLLQDGRKQLASVGIQ